MFVSLLAATIAGLLISQGARVWLLCVIVLAAMIAALATGWNAEATLGETAGRAIMIGIAIQLGYALGLFGSLAFRSRLTLLRDQIKPDLYSGCEANQKDIARR